MMQFRPNTMLAKNIKISFNNPNNKNKSKILKIIKNIFKSSFQKEFLENLFIYIILLEFLFIHLLLSLKTSNFPQISNSMLNFYFKIKIKSYETLYLKYIRLIL